MTFKEQSSSLFGFIPKDDSLNILLLLFLYILQGVPLGLASAIPYLLQGSSVNASFEYQAIFSWVFWPFSLKLLWAPVVDAIYLKRFGRRKSWLIPIQYFIGIWMLVLSYFIDDWFGRPLDNPWGLIGSNSPIKIHLITLGFFILTFLASTQDIVVDGWALTMLSKGNVAWASTCNSVGQMCGHIIAFLGFLALESPDVANNYIRSEPIYNRGIVSTNGFLYFWSIVFIISTTLVAILKRETTSKNCDETNLIRDENTGKSRNNNKRKIVVPSSPTESIPGVKFEDTFNERELKGIADENDKSMNRIECENDPELSLIDTYCIMKGVLSLRPILMYIAVQFAVKLTFSPSENIFALKAIELGVSKDKLVFLGVFLFPLQTTLPLIVTKWITGPNPMSLFLSSIIPRAVLGALSIPMIYYISMFRETIIDQSPSLRTPFALTSNNISTQSDLNLLMDWQQREPFYSSLNKSISYNFSFSFYTFIFVQYFAYTIFQNAMFVSQMGFHAKISDPQIGGTYMTLLNTATNLASSLPSTILLYLVEPLTWRSCRDPNKIAAGLASIGVNVPIAKLEKSQLSSSTLDYLTKLGEEFLTERATCKPMAGVEACEVTGGHCVTTLDGFYLEVVLCMSIGIISYFLFVRKSIKYLDSLPITSFYYRPKTQDNNIRRKRLSSAD